MSLTTFLSWIISSGPPKYSSNFALQSLCPDSMSFFSTVTCYNRRNASAFILYCRLSETNSNILVILIITIFTWGWGIWSHIFALISNFEHHKLCFTSCPSSGGGCIKPHLGPLSPFTQGHLAPSPHQKRLVSLPGFPNWPLQSNRTGIFTAGRSV